MVESLGAKLTQFFSQFKLIKYKRREVVLRAEDAPQGVYYIKKGFVRVYSISPDGGELTLNIFKPGSFFPLTWAIAGIENSYFYEALAPTDAYRAPKEEVVNFIRNDKEILYDVSKRVLVGLEAILVRLQYLTLGDAYHRVANALLMLGRRFGEKNGNNIKINLPVTQQDIAHLAGVTRETVSIELKKLKSDGYILCNKHFYVVNNLNKLKKESLIYVGGKPLPYTF